MTQPAGPAVGGRSVGAVEKGHEDGPGVGGSADGLIGQEELAEVPVAVGLGRRHRGVPVPLGLG
jgi:hypothetical protein